VKSPQAVTEGLDDMLLLVSFLQRNGGASAHDGRILTKKQSHTDLPTATWYCPRSPEQGTRDSTSCIRKMGALSPKCPEVSLLFAAVSTISFWKLDRRLLVAGFLVEGPVVHELRNNLS